MDLYQIHKAFWWNEFIEVYNKIKNECFYEENGKSQIEQEIERRKQEEERRKQEEERRKQEEERRKQEEERRKQEEERRKQEEERRKQEEEKRKQEEEKRKQEEEKRKQEEEKRKQEEEKRKQEEEKRKQEEEKRKQEEEKRKQEEEKRKQEEEKRRNKLWYDETTKASNEEYNYEIHKWKYSWEMKITNSDWKITNIGFYFRESRGWPEYLEIYIEWWKIEDYKIIENLCQISSEMWAWWKLGFVEEQNINEVIWKEIFEKLVNSGNFSFNTLSWYAFNVKTYEEILSLNINLSENFFSQDF